MIHRVDFAWLNSFAGGDTIATVSFCLIKTSIDGFNKLDGFIMVRRDYCADAEADADDLTDLGFFVRYLFFGNQIAASLRHCERR